MIFLKNYEDEFYFERNFEKFNKDLFIKINDNLLERIMLIN
jgi:hypothetical protein